MYYLKIKTDYFEINLIFANIKSALKWADLYSKMYRKIKINLKSKIKAEVKPFKPQKRK